MKTACLVALDCCNGRVAQHKARNKQTLSDRISGIQSLLVGHGKMRLCYNRLRLTRPSRWRTQMEPCLNIIPYKVFSTWGWWCRRHWESTRPPAVSHAHAPRSTHSQASISRVQKHPWFKRNRADRKTQVGLFLGFFVQLIHRPMRTKNLLYKNPNLILPISSADDQRWAS